MEHDGVWDVQTTRRKGGNKKAQPQQAQNRTAISNQNQQNKAKPQQNTQPTEPTAEELRTYKPARAPRRRANLSSASEK